jgi:ribosome-associated translation inhibitor RaiA
VDYSPALRYHASQRIGSSLAEFAPRIRSVAVRISNDAPYTTRQRRCEIDVVTTNAGVISASSSGRNLFALVDQALASLVTSLRQRAIAEPLGELHRQIA